MEYEGSQQTKNCRFENGHGMMICVATVMNKAAIVIIRNS